MRLGSRSTLCGQSDAEPEQLRKPLSPPFPVDREAEPTAPWTMSSESTPGSFNFTKRSMGSLNARHHRPEHGHGKMQLNAHIKRSPIVP